MVTTRARAARGPTRPEGPPPPGASRGPGEPSTSASGAAGGEGRGAWPAGYTVHRLVEELERPVAAYGAGVLRIGYGFSALMQLSIWRTMYLNFTRQPFVVPYQGVQFVKPLMPLHGEKLYLLLLLGSLSNVFGVGSRFMAPVNFFAFSYLFYQCYTNYNNHYVLMTHLFFVSIWVHWGAAFSLEAWFRRTVLRVARPGHPKVPAWQLGVLQALFCLPYFWGGVAKLNRDWLLRAQPVTGWFSEREGFPYDHWAFPWFICWGGCAFDLTISFLLTHRDDRVRYGLGFPGAIFFNVSNKLMLNIGVFPYMMLISLALFIKPEHWELVVDAVVPTGPTPTAKEKGKGRGAGGGGPRQGLGRGQKALLGSLAIFAAFEVLNPLRHFFYRSNVSWTEEGHIGAWHMKLRTKNGATVFQATTRAGDVYFLAPQVDPLLQTPGMRPKLKSIIQTRPWASLTYVVHLQRVFAAAGQELVKVQAHSCMALNYQARHHPLFIAEANLLDFIPRKYWHVFQSGVGSFITDIYTAPDCDAGGLAEKFKQAEADAQEKLPEVYRAAGYYGEGQEPQSRNYLAVRHGGQLVYSYTVPLPGP